MKLLTFIALSLFLNIFCINSENAIDFRQPQKKGVINEKQELERLRAYLYTQVIDLKKYLISEDNSKRKTAQQMIRRYDVIATRFNNEYQLTTQQIVRSYALRKIKKLLKAKEDKLIDLEKEAKMLSTEIDITFKGSKKPKTFLSVETVILVLGIVSQVEKYLKGIACTQAKDFYEQYRWQTAEEIFNGRQSVNYHFIDCDDFDTK